MKESKREKEIKAQIAELSNELTKVKEAKTIRCDCCVKRTQIKKATIITCYHYIQPSGCMDGDYWVFSHEYLFYCAKCDSFNRAYLGSFDKIDYFGKDVEDNVHPHALKEYRVKTYFLIDRNSHLFGEQLQDYDYKGTIDDIRKKNKEREESLKRMGCY